ncbi:MAG: hypothetical protein ACKOX3_03910 [Bacteroidota bacterium]
MTITSKIRILVFGLILLYSCGRTDNAFIVNKTQDTITLNLKLNYPTNTNRPDNYFRNQIMDKEKSTVRDSKLAGDCLIEFDSINNIATLRLLPNDRLKLGTIRTGLSRDDYKTWEFTEINIKGNNFQIDAKEQGIMTFVYKDKSWLTQDSHYFVIGKNSTPSNTGLAPGV